MKHYLRHTCILYLASCILHLVSCGSHDPDSTGGTGDIAFKIDWQNAPTSSKSKISNPTSLPMPPLTALPAMSAQSMQQSIAHQEVPLPQEDHGTVLLIQEV